MNKAQLKDYMKAWNEAHKEELKEYKKNYYQKHKKEHALSMKAWVSANKEHYKSYQKGYMKTYLKSDLNSLGQSKHSIRQKSYYILKKMNLHINGYEIHHCFGYEDASKFIYCSKSLHQKIHQFLRDNKINVDSDHWMEIRDIVNDTDKFVYIKC